MPSDTIPANSCYEALFNMLYTPLSSAENVLGIVKTQDLEAVRKALFLSFPAHQPCFQLRAVCEAFVSLDGHINTSHPEYCLLMVLRLFFILFLFIF